MKWLEHAFKILWLVGLFILLFIRFHYEQVILQTAHETFNQVPVLWFGTLIPLAMGLYLGLILMRGTTLRVNKSMLLFVALPCLAIVFYSPIAITIASMSSNSFVAPIPLWIAKLTDHDVLSIITGTALIAALFSDDTVPSAQ